MADLKVDQIGVEPSGASAEGSWWEGLTPAQFRVALPEAARRLRRQRLPKKVQIVLDEVLSLEEAELRGFETRRTKPLKRKSATGGAR